MGSQHRLSFPRHRLHIGDATDHSCKDQFLTMAPVKLFNNSMILNRVSIKGPNGMGSHYTSVQDLIRMENGGRQVSNIRSVKTGVRYSEMIMLWTVELIIIGHPWEIRFQKEGWDIQFINVHLIYGMSLGAAGQIDRCF